jgi:exopolysaccharide biosynthesis WecB/TagA/CpsF family protein
MTVAVQEDQYERWRRIIQKVRRIEDPQALESLLIDLRSGSRPQTLGFVNAHALNTVARSPDFFDALSSADMLLRDGSGIATLYSLMGQRPGLNMNGTDLIPILLRRFNGAKIALYGTSERYLARACRSVQRLVPDSALSSAHGFLPPEAYVERALSARPELIVLGMGMPKQEAVAQRLRNALQGPCLIVCGGAILDFLGARVSRAPRILRTVGLEWLYRLALEPRRLFVRYVIGNPVFLYRALRFTRAQRKALALKAR